MFYPHIRVGTSVQCVENDYEKTQFTTEHENYLVSKVFSIV